MVRNGLWTPSPLPLWALKWVGFEPTVKSPQWSRSSVWATWAFHTAPSAVVKVLSAGLISFPPCAASTWGRSPPSLVSRLLSSSLSVQSSSSRSLMSFFVVTKMLRAVSAEPWHPLVAQASKLCSWIVQFSRGRPWSSRQGVASKVWPVASTWKFPSSSVIVRPET